MYRERLIRVDVLPINSTASFFFLILVLWTSHAYAALRPEYERLNQFEFIIQMATDTDFGKDLGKGLIDKVEYLGDDKWRAWKKNCYIPISLISIPRQDKAVGGKRKYRADVEGSHCN